jgi:hypothetical protein
VLAERLDPKLFPIMAELEANATFDDHEGNIALMVWFGLHRLLDGVDGYAKRARS